MTHDQFLQEATLGLRSMPSICISKSSYFSILFYFFQLSFFPSLFLPLPASLPYTHTHTQTHTHTPHSRSVVKNLPANVGDTSSILGAGRPMEKEMATHSSILAWRIPWMEEHGEPSVTKELDMT